MVKTYPPVPVVAAPTARRRSHVRWERRMLRVIVAHILGEEGHGSTAIDQKLRDYHSLGSYLDRGSYDGKAQRYRRR